MASRELGEVIDISLLVVKTGLSPSLVQSGASIGADHRDVTLTVHNNNRKIAALDDVTDQLRFGIFFSRHNIKVCLNH